MRKKPIPVSERIKELMFEHGLTQEQFAELVEMPFPTVREMIYGKRTDPKLSQLIKLSRPFGMSIDEFVFGKRR